MIDNHPRELGFTRSEHEYTLYLKEDNDGHKLIMSLYVDDMLVIRKTKHIKVNFYLAREFESEGLIKILYCAFEEQLVDVLPKSLPRNKFEVMKIKPGMIEAKLKEKC